MSSSRIAKAASLKPEIRLAQSVSEFEAGLSDDHKANFRSYRSQALNKTPDPSDVMRLTAEIDRRPGQQQGSGRCFGPRLTNILQAVQQYAALGDIVVSGSQNIVACGIWSLVRLTLLVSSRSPHCRSLTDGFQGLVSFSSYMEKLSRILMVAGRKAPRYEQMTLLYPRSPDLQSSLSEYFIVVVQMCRDLYKATHNARLGTYFSFLSDINLKEHETSLQLWADCIKDEVMLLTARKITEQSAFLGVLSKNSEDESHRNRFRTQLHILEVCSTYDHQTTWKEIRKCGNSTILSRLDQYPRWKATAAGSRTLLCTGKLGFGKSVLLANMVDELNLSIKSTDSAVIYFFCRHDIQESLQARTIIGSIVRQLFNTNLSQLPDGYRNTNSNSSLDDLLQLVSCIISSDTDAFLVLDGLDECDEHERDTTLRALKRLQEIISLKICCSFRSDVHLRGAREAAGILVRIDVVHFPKENPDILTFVTAELQRCIASGRLCLGDATLESEIQHALVHRAEGMFLWVILQIESLCAAQSDEEIRAALEDLPKGLPETFSRILKKSRSTGKKYQKQILQLCLVAQRPLTTEELREALSVKPYNTEWNPARLINNIYSVLPFCGSLITIDEENLTIRFLHQSVKQYLVGDFDMADEPILTLEDANQTMGEVLVTYLNYNMFENALSTTIVPEMMAQDMPSKIAKATIRHSTPIRQVALRMFKRKTSYQHDLRGILIRARGASSHNLQLKFHAYAQAFWLWHVQWVFDQEDTKALQLLMRILEKKRVNINDKDENGENFLFTAAESASSKVVKQLLDYGSRVDIVGRKRRTALHLAAVQGRDDIVTCLLDSGADGRHQDEDYCTPLLLAASMGQTEVVDALLRTASNHEKETRNQDGRTAASMAAYKGQSSSLKSLLDKGVDIETTDNDRWTPLSLAAGAGRSYIVELLLDRGARITAVDDDGWTALHWAAYKGHNDVAQSLLERNADIEAKDKDTWTPLLLASARGHRAVVQSLIDRGANIQAKNRDGQSAPQIASNEGHETIRSFLDRHLANFGPSGETTGHDYTDFLATPSDKIHLTHVKDVRMASSLDGRTPPAVKSKDLFGAVDREDQSLIKSLLNKGADTEVRDGDGATPLLRAVSNGNISILKLLYENGANAHARAAGNVTALHLSAGRGHHLITLYLLECGIYVDARSLDGKTALHASARHGHQDIVELLLENGAGNGYTTVDGKTALHCSAEQGHLGIVKCLVNRGVVLGSKTVDGKSALDLAVEEEHLEVGQYLVSRGGAKDL
ncbi:hypothetical protein G7054_g9349 [Neopestalotiopsis clavispora]|nr:hypothetical protein G7054_g9349 [Neopestalotiopsis clavispora]